MFDLTKISPRTFWGTLISIIVMGGMAFMLSTIGQSRGVRAPLASYYNGVHIHENELDLIFMPQTATKDECAQKCLEAAGKGCIAFVVVVKADERGKQCWLFKALDQSKATSSDCCILGTMKEAPAWLPPLAKSNL